VEKRKYKNRLNDLSNKEWIKFQKSWFIHNPPPRKKTVLRHPAKFPETLIKEFIEFFTKKAEVIFDPMAGTGSTLVAALHSGRNSYGLELNPVYADIATQWIEKEKELQEQDSPKLKTEIIAGDASEIQMIFKRRPIPEIDYVITSPPYWDMLHRKGAQTQKRRRENPGLDLFYSDDPNDLGNIQEYDLFLDQLVNIYKKLKPFLRERAYITIIVKNIKKDGVIYPLAWDLAKEMSKSYTLKDEKLWCIDNQRLAPYGMGNAWVSNTFHHYCLQFRNE